VKRGKRAEYKDNGGANSFVSSQLETWWPSDGTLMIVGWVSEKGF
jgi:hypothetical protein